MIEIKAVIHKKKFKLKKVRKLLEWDKKMILMRYKDWSIYWLYNKKSDSVVVSESVDFNEDLLTDENTENSEITNKNSISQTENFIFETEFFTEFFIKFFNKENRKIFDSSDSMSESVKDKAEAKKNVMKILSSQKEMSIMKYEKFKKNNICK